MGTKKKSYKYKLPLSLTLSVGVLHNGFLDRRPPLDQRQINCTVNVKACNILYLVATKPLKTITLSDLIPLTSTTYTAFIPKKGWYQPFSNTYRRGQQINNRKVITHHIGSIVSLFSSSENMKEKKQKNNPDIKIASYTHRAFTNPSKVLSPVQSFGHFIHVH